MRASRKERANAHCVKGYWLNRETANRVWARWWQGAPCVVAMAGLDIPWPNKPKILKELIEHRGRSVYDRRGESIVVKHPGEVYFITMEIPGDQPGPVKIGYSLSPEHRLEGLQLASPYPLRLLGAFRAPVTMEGQLHVRFAADLLRGEWYQPSAALLAFITQNTDPRRIGVTETQCYSR